MTQMFQKKRIIAGILAITLIFSLFMEITPVYAYNLEEYEELEGKYVVDNKHNSPSHVNLYILSEKINSGYFNYNFYQTDGQDYYNGAVTTPLIFHTRGENLKQIKAFSDNSYLYLVTFGIENGKYVFSNNFCIDATTLTPDYKNPQKVNPIGTTSEKAYLDSYMEHFVDVTDETINVYCVLGDTDWVDMHIDNLISYAKEHDTSNEYINTEMNEIDATDADELREALAEIEYENDLLDDFLTELEKEEIESQESSELNEYTPFIALDTEMVEDTMIEANVDTEENTNTIGNVFAWVVTIFFFIVFILGCIWQKRRKADNND